MNTICQHLRRYEISAERISHISEYKQISISKMLAWKVICLDCNQVNVRILKDPNPVYELGVG